jgi:hypothetical protein
MSIVGEALDLAGSFGVQVGSNGVRASASLEWAGGLIGKAKTVASSVASSIGVEGAGAKASDFLSNRIRDVIRPYEAIKNHGLSKEAFKAAEGWSGVGKSAGTYMGAAMGPRVLSGSLNPMVNADGERDIVGIPFI